jgi:hypothetical protein
MTWAPRSVLWPRVYRRRRDRNLDGINVRGPDGLEIILLCVSENVRTTAPPAWLYWYR